MVSAIIIGSLDSFHSSIDKTFFKWQKTLFKVNNCLKKIVINCISIGIDFWLKILIIVLIIYAFYRLNKIKIAKNRMKLIVSFDIQILEQSLGTFESIKIILHFKA